MSRSGAPSTPHTTTHYNNTVRQPQPDPAFSVPSSLSSQAQSFTQSVTGVTFFFLFGLKTQPYSFQQKILLNTKKISFDTHFGVTFNVIFFLFDLQQKLLSVSIFPYLSITLLSWKVCPCLAGIRIILITALNLPFSSIKLNPIIKI